MIKVVFSYDENRKLWNPVVYGARDNKEAMQAFNALALTCKVVVPTLKHLEQRCSATEDGGIRIIPAKMEGDVQPGENVIRPGDVN